MNNKMCKGINYTQALFDEVFINKSFLSVEELQKAMDPLDLMPLFFENLFDDLAPEGNGPEAAETHCRAIYDNQNYGKAYCCQMTEESYSNGRESATYGFIVDATKTVKADPIILVLDGVTNTLDLGAETYKAAQRLTGLASAAIATILFLN